MCTRGVTLRSPAAEQADGQSITFQRPIVPELPPTPSFLLFLYPLRRCAVRFHVQRRGHQPLAPCPVSADVSAPSDQMAGFPPAVNITREQSPPDSSPPGGERSAGTFSPAKTFEVVTATLCYVNGSESNHSPPPLVHSPHASVR